MAKKVLIEQYYTFNPAVRTVVIPKAIQRENLILITNVTQNKVIYNFSDPNLTAITYTVNNGVTTVVLNYNTTTMNSQDSLQFTYDDTIQEIVPAETYNDPVQKMRVSTPQSLIDTDFEYGTQPTKWENISLLNGRPSFFVDLQQPIANSNVLATSGSNLYTVYANYTSGTGNIVTANTGSTTITGSGTAFTTQLFVGNALYNTSESLIGIISSIESDTSLTLQSNSLVNISNTAFRFAPQPIPAIGSPLQVQDTIFTQANGGFIIQSTTPVIASSRWEIVYRGSARFTGTTGSILNSGVTQIFAGVFYSNAAIQLTSAVAISASGAGVAANDVVVQITSARNHGLTVGNLVYLTGAATISGGTNPGGASYTVIGVQSPTRFTVIMAPGSNVPTITAIGTLTAFVRHESTFTHRPHDGGIKFSTNNQSHNYQAVRQSRRYFRYQSGKGIQFSTGSVIRPNFTVDAITYNSTTLVCTVTTKEPHNLQPGTTVNIFNATEPGLNTSAYNGTVTVIDVNNEFDFTYAPVTTPSILAAQGFPQVTVVNWRGAVMRCGMYDQQNGMFFEYDGQRLFAVRRSSTAQISGQITVTNGTDVVDSVTTLGVGKQTKFTKQLVPGDFIVIRGQSYRVMELINDTRIRINPEYRGTNLTAGIVSRVVDFKIPQTEWNIDRCDGYGPSGFTIDLNKMQMIYIDYAWYGAGSIRYGFKDQNGNIIYCHRIVNTNQNTEAYMRSGNLPARYECSTFVPQTTMTANFASGSNTLTVASTADFPDSGVLLIADPGRSPTDVALASGGPGTADYYEYLQYNGKTNTTFTITQRGAGLGMTGTNIDGYRSNYFNTVGGNVTTVNGSNTVACSKGFAVNTLGNAINMVPVGSYVTGTGIPENTFITSYNVAAKTIELSQAATASAVITDFLVYAMSSNANGTTNNGPLHTFSANGPSIGVFLHTQQFAPTFSHWGSAVIMDGRYDDDKSLIFTAGNAGYLQNYTSATNALLSLRIAPSVDNGATGVLGARELINRMQLKLVSLGVTTNGAFIIRLILNPRFVNNAPVFQGVGGSSLAQVAYHPSGTQITGGETIFAFYSDQGAGSKSNAVSTFDLSQVRDLGNSINGGGLSNTLTLNSQAGIYPDGPDIVTVVCSNVQSPVNVPPTNVTAGSPIIRVGDSGSFEEGYIVTANGGGGVPLGSVVRSISPLSAGNTDVAFTRNATSAVLGTLVLAPPGNIAARLQWTEAQA
jgi:hypothetical protein